MKCVMDYLLRSNFHCHRKAVVNNYFQLQSKICETNVNFDFNQNGSRMVLTVQAKHNAPMLHNKSINVILSIRRDYNNLVSIKTM